jgi:hypothetical protein
MPSADAAEAPSAGVTESCATCGAPLADDQRYCLECGERRTPMSSVLLGGPPVSGSSGDSQQSATPPPFPPQGALTATGAGQRGNTVTVIAGVGVLLLAMGVGVLIGRAGNSKPVAAPAQVISVAQPGASTTGAATTTTPTPTTPEASSTKGASPASKPGAKQGASGAGAKGGGAKTAAPATPKSSSPGQGKSYEEKSKNLPNVVTTG